MARLFLTVALVLLLAGCGGGSVENVFGGERPEPSVWDESWADRRGDAVPELVVSTGRGPAHCDWQSVVFLHLGWPLGTDEKMGPARQYVRDPKGLLSDYIVVPLDLEARLAADAKYTGYHLGDVQLWVSKREARKAVYIVRGDRVERWPRTKEVIACA